MTASRHRYGGTSFAVPLDDALVALRVPTTEEYPDLAAGRVPVAARPRSA